MPRKKSDFPEGSQPASTEPSERAPRIFSEHLKSQGFRPIVDERGQVLTSKLDPLPKGQWNTYFFFTGTVPHWVTVVCDEEGKLWTKHTARADTYVVLTGSSHGGFKRTELQGKDWGTPAPIHGAWLLDINIFQRDGEFLLNAYRNGALLGLGEKSVEQIITKLEELAKNPAFSNSRELADTTAELSTKLAALIEERKQAHKPPPPTDRTRRRKTGPL